MSARLLTGTACALAMLMAGATGLSAQGTNAPGARGPGGGKIVAPYARVAAFVGMSGPTVKRSKNVKEVTRPSTGVYCILPTSVDGQKVTPAKSAASVTVEWGSSLGHDLLAYWEGNTVFGCPSDKYFEVRTYQFGGGSPVLSDNVSFTIIIP